MRSERKETWKLHFAWNEKGQVQVPCHGVEDGRKELHRLEKHAGKSVLWAEIIHTVTTVATMKLEVSA